MSFVVLQYELFLAVSFVVLQYELFLAVSFVTVANKDGNVPALHQDWYDTTSTYKSNHTDFQRCTSEQRPRTCQKS